MTAAEKLREEGRLEGREEGKAQLLLRLLAFRLGPLSPELQARVMQAAPADVERWAERVLGAASIDDVFC